MKNKLYLLLPLFCLGLACTLTGQSTYLDKLVIKPSDETYITATDDGGWMVTYSVKNDPNEFFTDAIQIIKYDPCTEIEWAKEYQVPGQLLNVNGLLKHSNGDYFLSGITRTEPINSNFFLLRIKPNGNADFLKIFEKPFPEILYSFGETPAGNFMLFGISYDNATVSRNCFLTLNTEGELLSASSHIEAGIWGRGLACSDGGYIGRMSSRIYKVDADGNALWANQFTGISNASAPLEVADGYIFASSRNSNTIDDPHFLFKLDFNGDLVWVSPGYYAKGYATLEILPNGNILCLDSYVDPTDPDNRDASFITFSQTGEQISNQKLLRTFAPRSALGRDIAIHPDGSVLFSTLSGANLDTLLVGKSDTQIDFACGQSDNLDQDTIKVLEYTSFSVPNNSITFNITDYAPIVLAINPEAETICENQSFNLPPPLPDTTICLDEELLLQINIPGATLEWENGSTEDSLVVSSSGDYEISVTFCGQTETFVYQSVTVEECPCFSAVPNAFTPDGDGENDVFNLLFNCPLSQFKMVIYSRWGELVFSSDDASTGWNGMKDASPAPMDVYLYRIIYQFEGRPTDEIFEEIGDLSLIR